MAIPERKPTSYTRPTAAAREETAEGGCGQLGASGPQGAAVQPGAPQSHPVSQLAATDATVNPVASDTAPKATAQRTGEEARPQDMDEREDGSSASQQNQGVADTATPTSPEPRNNSAPQGGSKLQPNRVQLGEGNSNPAGRPKPGQQTSEPPRRAQNASQPRSSNPHTNNLAGAGGSRSANNQAAADTNRPVRNTNGAGSNLATNNYAGVGGSHTANNNGGMGSTQLRRTASPDSEQRTSERTEAQLAEIAAQRAAAETAAQRLADEEARLRQKLEAERQHRQQLAQLHSQQGRLRQELASVRLEEQDWQGKLAALDQELAALGSLSPADDAQLASSRLLSAIHQAGANLLDNANEYAVPPWLPPANAAALTADPPASYPPAPTTYGSYTQRPYQVAKVVALRAGRRTVQTTMRALGNPRVALFIVAGILALTLFVLTLYLGVFSDNSKQATGFHEMDKTPTMVAMGAANDSPTPDSGQALATSVPTAQASAITQAAPPAVPSPATTQTAASVSATPTSEQPDGTATPNQPAISIAATPATHNSQAGQAASTPSLNAAAQGNIPTGAKVIATSTPPPQHQPASELVALAIPALNIDSAVVTVTPVVGPGGQAYWGVDATRVGLQTPGVGCGEAGNIILNGHNWVTHGVFVALGKLHHQGNLASLNAAQVICKAQDGQSYTYKVFAYGVFEADDNSFEQLVPGEQRDLTFYTCTNSGRQRIVIVARLVV